jgi:16S rRNA (guanine1516-N2)-methyltransferase
LAAPHAIPLVYTDPRLADYAREVAARARAELQVDPSERMLGYHPYILVLTPQRLELRHQAPPAHGPVYVDFVGGHAGHRRRFGGGRNQALARACGLGAGTTPTVVDATAGLGRDAFVLASLGCTVTLIERSAVVAALLHDGLARANMAPDTREVIGRMRLVVADAREWMARLPDGSRPDVVYLDPMYPVRDKSALAKKEMRAFRALVGDDEDAPALLRAGLGCAQRRVTVKRPRLAEPIAGPARVATILGKTTRYDLYSPGQRE